ncbi:hypothetical protein H5410_010579 [Solanum commersonii]|uniref:Uncharacterized protein n=1 Tax=Solanum commersonii TaxID=4109 RepID=A0A9J6ALU9_SOLCO|nr:hypothetical protein H5410_010579 [Solanum commersonii]
MGTIDKGDLYLAEILINGLDKLMHNLNAKQFLVCNEREANLQYFSLIHAEVQAIVMIGSLLGHVTASPQPTFYIDLLPFQLNSSHSVTAKSLPLFPQLL